MAKEKVKNWFEVRKVSWSNARVDTHIGNYVAEGEHIYVRYTRAVRVAKRLSAETGWPVVKK